MDKDKKSAPVVADDLRQWILAWLARELQVPETSIGADESLLRYKMDSVNAIMLVGDLEDRLGIRLSPTLVWDSPTVNQLVESVMRERASVAPAGQHNVAPAPMAEAEPAMDPHEARALLDRLDELSDAEVERLLKRLSNGESGI